MTARRPVLLVAVLVTTILGGAGWPTVASARPLERSAPAHQTAPAPSVRATSVADLATEDPGIDGPDPVDELHYDLGDLAFQPEGFPAKVELAAEVYAPEVIEGQAPLVVLLHGRHATCADATDQELVWPCPNDLPEVPSYLGYGTLARNLASHGVVVVSISANGINAADDFLDDGGASARGQLVLEHLRLWQQWTASAAGSPFADRFVGHIDLTDVGLMGHSRGGEGVVAAAQLNQQTGAPFGIKAVLALAPTDFDHRVLGGVPLGVVLPYCDGDVSDLEGSSYYDDARYANPGDPAPKMTTLLYGANHNFFNTVWTSGPGSFDDAAATGLGPARAADPCQPGGAARLAASVQDQAGAAIMAGFFRRYLQGDLDLQRSVTGTAPFPASTGPARWSVAYEAPDRLDVERFDTPATITVNRLGQFDDLQALSSGLVCNPSQSRFEAPMTATVAVTAPCPNTSGGLAVANDTGALDVGWVRPSAVLREPLAPAGVDVTAYDGLRFRVAVPFDSRNATRAEQDISVVLEDADGHRASVRAAAGSNALFPIVNSQVRHAVLNGVRIPLSAFAGIDLTHVRAVELRFDRTNAGRVALADLAFTREDTGAATGPASGGPTVAAPRPVCRRTASARWGCALAQLMWGRDPAPDELAWLSAGYPRAGTRRQVIARVVATRAAAALHELRFAERYTGAVPAGGDTAPDLSASGRVHWDVGVVELTSRLAYSTASVGSTHEIIESAYRAFTGRSADPAGLAYWTRRVDDAGPGALASSLVQTSAYRGRVVDERYRQILGRSPDPSGRAYWVRRLAVADGEQLMVRTLLESDPFRLAASS